MLLKPGCQHNASDGTDAGSGCVQRLTVKCVTLRQKKLPRVQRWPRVMRACKDNSRHVCMQLQAQPRMQGSCKIHNLPKHKPQSTVHFNPTHRALDKARRP